MLAICDNWVYNDRERDRSDIEHVLLQLANPVVHGMMEGRVLSLASPITFWCPLPLTSFRLTFAFAFALAFRGG